MQRIKIDDLAIAGRSVFRAVASSGRSCANWSTNKCRRSTKRLRLTNWMSTTNRHWIWSFPVVPRQAFQLADESEATRESYGRNTFGDSLLLARRLVEAGTRVVEVIWPKVANSDNHSWDQHKDLSKRMKNQSGPMFDAGLSGLIEDLDERGMLEETMVVAIGEFGRSPQRGVSTSGNDNSNDGRDHWPYCYTGLVAGAGIKRGYVHGKSDKTASAPLEDPVHPGELLASIYHAFGINPETMVMNHLNQPRELVKAHPVHALFA